MVDIHPPHEPVRSVRDFLYHLLTVVIGILIALSLEGLLEWHHHRSLAEQAQSNLMSEVRENHDRLQKGLAKAPDAEQRLAATVNAIEALRKTHTRPPGFDWSFGVFLLSNTAWRTAEGTGTLTYMDYPAVAGYTRIYTLQDQFNTVQQRSLEQWLALQKWGLRADPKNGFSQLPAEELTRVEDAATTALMYTQEEESVARTLVQEYERQLASQGKSE
ncbi:MAG: hypothetical protein WAU58_10645 [Terriglobales bacterium]|jgi:hypothetical protein